MKEEELIKKIEDIVARYERLVKIQTKQRDYLLHYVSRLVLPVQLNAIMEKLEEMANE